MKPITLLLAELILTASFVLGQISGGTGFDTLVAGIGTISATGVLAWYIWYDVTKTRPTYQRLLEKITETQKESLEQQRKHYETLLEKHSKDHIDQFISAIREVLAKEQ